VVPRIPADKCPEFQQISLPEPVLAPEYQQNSLPEPVLAPEQQQFSCSVQNWQPEQVLGAAQNQRSRQPEPEPVRKAVNAS